MRGGGQQETGESIADLFHENTKLRRPVLADSSGEENYSVWELEAMARAYKRYRLHPQTRLPPPVTDGAAARGFAEVIANRRSRRDFSSAPLELDELSALLRWSYGITGETRIPGGGIQYFRAAPSAGGLYPAEIYLGVRSVRGLDPGLYHYEVTENSLALLNRGNPADILYKICCGQAQARNAAVVVLISARANSKEIRRSRLPLCVAGRRTPRPEPLSCVHGVGLRDRHDLWLLR